jgi:NADH-quinone oxidoreductase subunit A
MPTEYLPILLYMALAAAITLVILLGNRILGASSRPKVQKQMPYESGIQPVGSARERFHIRYHVIAMIFLIFDLEIAFIYPWAVLYKQLGWPGFIEMMVFLGILLIGFLYAWKRGAFQWE